MKIGIANDMPMAAEALRRALTLTPEHQVVWIARDGEQAVELCARQPADLVLMDLIMPGIDGVEATRRIMAGSPCAILIVTVSVETHASRVFEAMGFGALDAIDTPTLGSGDLATTAASLLAKIAAIGRLIGAGGGLRRLPAGGPAHRSSARALVAIGASAGGPAALSVLLGGLPHDLPAAVVIVQHVDARFAPGLAEWLSQQSRLPVRLAKEGDRLQPGAVLVAGTSDHLVLKTGSTLGYTSEPREFAYRPSVDVFFNSVCSRWPGNVTGVLLTGMGADGARGLKSLRAKGHHTIAQDQATSAVYGMPKAAVALQAAVDVLPLKNIAQRLVRGIGSKATLGAAG
ncbi:MAG: chemotaxis response regulator protein-glutamate methylesterase [Methylobacteriaceae bacterium]|nr:chemotaxis response regulator protein-glutamate methylesterase [Methylobacteriaceae bacterium]